MNTRSLGLRRALTLCATATLVGSLLATAGTAIAANPSANLDQCANGAAPSPSSDGCATTASEWVNGNLGASKSTYLEGDSIPYRLRFDNLGLASHTVSIEWDTTKSGKHAIDYIDDYNESVLDAKPCLGVAGCSGDPTTFPIPKDPQITTFTPNAGSFSMWGGTVTSVSAYSYPNGAGFTGDKSARISITFTATVKNPVLAWGGHISTRLNWGVSGSAVAISGSPYHTRLLDLDGSGGNQDRSLSADAVIFPGSITVIKDATPNGSTSFGFTATPAPPLSNFTLVDDGTAANTKVFSNITVFQTYTVNESSIPAGWGFDSVSCSATSPNGGSTTTSSTTVNIGMKEGENWTCTYLDSLRTGSLTVIKHVVNDNGGTAAASNWSLHVKSGTTEVTGSPQAGAESPGTSYTLSGGSYNVSETGGPSGYTFTGFSGDCDSSGNVTVVAGATKTCTLTNNDDSPGLHLRKTVTNDNGGSAADTDWTLTATGTGSTPTNLSGTTPVDSGATFKADTYALAETGGPAGYTASAWTCPGATMPDATHVTVPFGGNVTCTINNNDNAPALHLVKTVTNDNGGTAAETDWTLSATGTGSTPTNLSGTTPVDSGATFKADTYALAETAGPAGYTAGAWSCPGATMPDATHVTVPFGGNVTCTINNNDTKNNPAGSTTMRWYVSDDASFTIRAGASDASDATIAFKLYSDDSCQTQVGSTATVDVTVNGAGDKASAAMTQAQAISVTPDTYYWRATYSGDAFNNGTTTECGSEVTTITDDSPTS